MTSYLAVTTCNAEQWARFGRAMVNTFCRHWPAEVRLFLYQEGFRANRPECADDAAAPTLIRRDLEADAPWLVEFKARHTAPQFNGGSNRRDYRRDAVRFAHKVAAIGAAAEATSDVLIWIDADVVTHEPVTVEWLDSLFPEPAELAWLDRDRTYPECGFMMFRMPAARKLIRAIVKAYTSGAIFSLPETHDSYVIQHVVRQMGVKTHSLSGPEGRKHAAHPFIASELASRMDHLKGEIRKHAGRSFLGQTLKHRRPEPYWQ